MDALDAAILNAWSTLAPALRADRVEALRRAKRLTQTTLRRPLRPWCCCIRAGDTRIESHNREAYTVSLDAEELRSLCAPVYIPWPGLRLTIVAQKLGFHGDCLRAWKDRGVFGRRNVHPHTVGSRGGKLVPVLWTRAPVDPSADLVRAPDPEWGSLWLDLHKDIPDEAALTVRRVPVHRDDGHLLGWRFICPGLTKHCGRRAKRLFLPMPGWTMLHAEHKELAEAWQDHRETRWACRHCHQVRSCSFVSRHGWNAFVTYMTSGMLYGHEVERPASLRPKRKRKYRSRDRLAPRQEQALALREAGHSYKEIARMMGVKVGAVTAHLYLARKARKLLTAAPVCRP